MKRQSFWQRTRWYLVIGAAVWLFVEMLSGPAGTVDWTPLVFVLAFTAGGWWLIDGRRRRALSARRTLDQLQAMDPLRFEEWVAERFRARGYSAELTPPTGDHGIDIVIRRDRRTAVVQCKRYADTSPLGETVVRDLYGAMHHARATRAYLVTTSHFTPAAREWAEDKPIKLWDGTTLIGLSGELDA